MMYFDLPEVILQINVGNTPNYITFDPVSGIGGRMHLTSAL